MEVIKPGVLQLLSPHTHAATKTQCSQKKKRINHPLCTLNSDWTGEWREEDQEEAGGWLQRGKRAVCGDQSKALTLHLPQFILSLVL